MTAAAQVTDLTQSPSFVTVDEREYLRLKIQNYRNEIRNLARANDRLKNRLNHSYVAEVENKNRMLHAQLRRLKEENASLKGDD